MAILTTPEGVGIHYESYGEGAKTILFVHGYFGSGESFTAVSADLLKDFRVVVFDHRAHGQSDAPEDGYTITHLARDMKTLVDTLGLAPVIPIGYSMGTHVLWRYIELYGTGDFEKVVFSVMSPKLVTDERYKLGLHGDTPAQTALDMLVTANRSMEEYVLRDLREGMSAEVEAAVRATALRISLDFKHGQIMRLLLAMFEHDFWPVLDMVNCPALVIAGDNDIYPTACHEEVARRLPDGKLVIVENSGHLVMYERPDIFFKAIREFVS
ncbi:MAG: alpha/beta hydrolase [Oscillospiraceae bacterium]|jgi:pimeloyl-ACP methyl ester carboxylesterase|nr:alpha/beta hydrolase [Oscillospiraceae bacterium]